MASDIEYDLIITNGVCVTASDVAAWDIAIKDEKIVLQASTGTLAHAKAKRIIDAEGGYVMVRTPDCLRDPYAKGENPVNADSFSSLGALTATPILKNLPSSSKGRAAPPPTVGRQAHVRLLLAATPRSLLFHHSRKASPHC